ncbi:MAG: SDR family NAD(P)-dependent oxidoreductase [Saprospiraceae bacterium]|jgi:NADP-dependent 3-hydroxy acid dehydrogenase YdfG/Tfp pilus assembly protein PilF
MKKIALAYCLDNLHTAESIAQGLKPGNFAIEHYYCKKTTQEAPLSQQLQSFDGVILLVISDNFLRSVSCMNEALNLLQQRSADILPIVIDGYQRDENSGAPIPVPTRFEKIGDIIPYINYWQNQYLDLRSQRRKLDQETDFDKDALNEHIRILRQVSAEASEFLRLLRNTSHLDLDDFTANDYEALFQFLDDQAAWSLFRQQVKDYRAGSPDEAIGIPIPPFEGNDVPAPTKEEESPEPEQKESFIPTLEEVSELTIPPLGISEEPEPSHTEPQQDDILSEDVPGAGNPVEPGSELPIAEPPVPEEPLGAPSNAEPEESFVTPISDGGAPEENPVENPAASDPLSEHAPTEPTVSVEELLQQGIQLAETGTGEACAAFFESALQQHPEAAALRYHYALFLAQNAQDLNPAIGQLQHLLQVHPNDEQANFLMGELLELQGRDGMAFAHYAKIAEINPEFPDIFYRMGKTALRSSPDREEAARLFKQACKHNPAHVDAHYQYALLALEVLGKKEKALKYLEKTLAIMPEHPFAYYDMALIYYGEKQHSKAKKCYLQAIARNPDFKTPENDTAFGLHAPELPAASAASTPDSNQVERDMIEKLKNMIAELEDTLRAKKEQQVPQNRFSGKTVLITGATSGIGRATALLFAQNGHRLILTGRRSERLSALCQEIHQNFQAPTLPLVFDIRDVEAVHHALSAIPEEWQAVDILINNAGKAKGLAPVQEGKLAHWEEMIDTNLKGLLYITREIARGMVQRKSGHIINLSSIAGRFVYPNGNVYCATKAAVDALTQGLRMDLYAHNIRVSQVAPGHVEETEFALVRFDGDAEAAKIYEGFQPLTAADVADTIYYIASRPAHVNVQDVLVFGTQQASATLINRSGRDLFNAG